MPPAVFVAADYERSRLRRLAAATLGDEVLDLGCSQGMNEHLRRPGRRITGLDLAPPTGSVRYDRHLVGDVFELAKLDDGRAYDSIVMGEFIEHVERPYDLLRLLRGHLVPAGRLLVSTPNPLAIPVAWFEWARSPRRFFTDDHAYHFSPRWVVRMLERTGYVVRAVEAVGLWPTGWPCPVGLSYQIVYVADVQP